LYQLFLTEEFFWLGTGRRPRDVLAMCCVVGGCASVSFKQWLLFLSDGQELCLPMDIGMLVLMRRIYMPSFRFLIGYLEAKKQMSMKTAK
jgi:hypothetical protein